VEVRVDDVADRLGGDKLEILDERARRGRRGAGVDDEDVAVADNRHVVAARDHRSRGCRVVDAARDRFELVSFARGDRIGGLRLPLQ